MRSARSKIYAILLTALFLISEVLLFCLPVFSGIDGWIDLLVGLVIALILAPTVHEIGHLSFACAFKMKPVFVKFFCFKIQKKGGRYAFSLANPFEEDQTQVIPIQSGDMQKRAKCYALGGLVFGGVFFAVFFLSALILSCFGIHSAKLWGIAPYSGYLFLLNAFPLEYPSGKTDMLVYKGICKGTDAERAMVMAMEIQGLAYEGTPYAQMQKENFMFPVLAEDEPLFAVCHHLKYRLALDEENYENASDALNRLAQSECYLSDFERERLAAEITYMHVINSNVSTANETAKYCEEYLKSDSLSAKRILATVAFLSGRIEESQILKNQAEKLLDQEEVLAEKYLEKKLLSRLDFKVKE
ncbi:MAG: hypothetical protein E7343_00730 [Clostridiales bacterium]|nr:hypothetical protein [Clostridiales bacterium]